MARTDSERLQFYQDLREKVENALLEGVPVISYSIEGRTTTREPTAEWLQFLDNQIAKLRAQAGSFHRTRESVELRSR